MKQMAKKQPQAVIMTKEQAREAKKAAESAPVEEQSTFEPNGTAYFPVLNKKTGYYELWNILLNTETGEVEIEVENTKAASIQAIYGIMQTRYTHDLLLTKSKKGGK